MVPNAHCTDPLQEGWTTRSRMRYRGARSNGNASVTWRVIHSAVGFAVTPNDTQSRRPWRTMTRQYRIWNAIVGRTKRYTLLGKSANRARCAAQPDGARKSAPLRGIILIEKLSKSGGGKQLVPRLVQMLSGSARAREVPDKLSGQFVYVDAPKIVELLTPKTENSRTADRRDVDALAVEDFSIHRTQSYFAFTFSPSSTGRRDGATVTRLSERPNLSARERTAATVRSSSAAMPQAFIPDIARNAVVRLLRSSTVLR
jgi:hypothetical protein